MVALFVATNNTFLNAQQNFFGFSFKHLEYGCYTYGNERHYKGLDNPQHRNDNNFVKGLIDNFWEYVDRYNAVEYNQKQKYYKGDCFYRILKSNYLQGIRRLSGTDEGRYVEYTYQIYQL
jgi:hypothetical protein